METCASGGQWPGQHQGKCHQTCWSPHSSRQPPARLSNCTKYLYISVVTGQPQPSPAQPSPAQHIYTECGEAFIAPTLAVLLRCCPATETNVDILLSA